MDLQTRKIEFIQEFLEVQSEDIVIQLEKLLKKETVKMGKEDKLFSVDEFNNRINKSMLDSWHNKLTENREVLAEMHKCHLRFIE